MKKNYSKRSSNAYCKKMYWLATIFILAFSYSNLRAQTTTFNYSGTMESYVIPAGVTDINITTLGAQGASGDPSYVGGKGAKMSGDFFV